MSRSPRRLGEDGFALIMVIGSMAVLTVFVVGALTFAMTNIRPARHTQDWQAALAAAQAGVDDYLRHLQDDDLYWTKENTDSSNMALSTTNWLTVPGPAGVNVGQFHYFVIDTRNQTVRLLVTGKVNNVQRTIEADLRKPGFLEYLYFTDYETLDPNAYPTSGSRDRDWAASHCNKYYYAGRHQDCTDIVWVTGDVVNGPMHSNDALNISGHPRYTDKKTETSWPNGLWYGGGSPATSPKPAYDPHYSGHIDIPVTNAAIEQQAALEGCLYTGPTRIVLKSTGKMDVMSPKTTNPNPGCGTGPMTGLQKGLSLPANGVIYVQDSTGKCTLPVLKSNDPATPGYPMQDESRGNLPQGLDYNCLSGDAYIEGSLKGQLTIATQNDVYITGNTTYAGGTNGSDVLGLIPENFAMVYHPLRHTGGREDSSGTYSNLQVPKPDGTGSRYLTDIKIQAAILSLKTSFLVQNWNKGASLGKVSVFGVIAQTFRGPVGTTSGTGYLKDYNYDVRLMALPPPNFLPPANVPWQASSMSEQKNP